MTEKKAFYSDDYTLDEINNRETSLDGMTVILGEGIESTEHQANTARKRNKKHLLINSDEIEKRP